jgi:hypothetical protein
MQAAQPMQRQVEVDASAAENRREQISTGASSRWFSA